MSGSNERERRELLAYLEKSGWRLKEGDAYVHVKCACGKHQKWVHKTPSNPNYWRETRAWADRICGRP